ncbi:MAG TPA: glycosyltransferase family 4 protein [Chitinophagaceae bacterium]|nr:glycosyltransferase family 4 protein [Chitinophagaceae bacterium]
MKVAFIVRSTIFTEQGGDTIQVLKTAKYLEQLGIHVDIRLSNQKVVYSDYDLLHFFNLGRPADILGHIEKTDTPFVVSTIYVDYEEYDKKYRFGLNEYFKVIGRRVVSGEKIGSNNYLWLGQRRSIQKVINRAACLLPNSESEMNRLKQEFNISCSHTVIPNGIDSELFKFGFTAKEAKDNILCVARIEGIKNQLNLIKSVADTNYKLYLVGAPAIHQKKYYEECRKAAGANVIFIDHLSQEELIPYYRKAKVHVLPSWFETTGLSSLEAAAMGCNIVISNRGDAHEYFGDKAFYCDPASPESILDAIDQASFSPVNPLLQKTIYDQYTWNRAAEKTAEAYQNVLAYEDRNTRNKRHPEPVRRV